MASTCETYASKFANLPDSSVAAAKVLATAELFEMIMLNLSSIDLLEYQRVSKDSRSMIRGSINIQRHMHFIADDTATATTINPLLQAAIYRPDISTDRLAPEDRRKDIICYTGVGKNSKVWLSFNAVSDEHESQFEKQKRILKQSTISYDSSEPIWKKMLAVQTPHDTFNVVLTTARSRPSAWEGRITYDCPSLTSTFSRTATLYDVFMKLERDYLVWYWIRYDKEFDRRLEAACRRQRQQEAESWRTSPFGSN